MNTRYAHATLSLDGLPILEQTEIGFEIEPRSTIVETAGHFGSMNARGKPKVTGTLDMQIPRDGHEYDYIAAIAEGRWVNVQWMDGGSQYSARVLLGKLSMRDNPNGERSCSIPYEGFLVAYT